MALLAMATLAVSHAVMVAVMTMTPLHMRDHGQAELSGLVIAVHVLGMYGFSPLVGRYTDRQGAARTIRDGALVLVARRALVGRGRLPAVRSSSSGCFSLASAGASVDRRVGAADGFGAGASRGSRPKDSSDTLLSGLAAAAALVSGLIKQGWGFHWLANLAGGECR